MISGGVSVLGLEAQALEGAAQNGKCHPLGQGIFRKTMPIESFITGLLQFTPDEFGLLLPLDGQELVGPDR